MADPWDTPFPTTAIAPGTTAPWVSASSKAEIDLRDEMRRLLHGATDEIAKGRIGMLRRIRRDENDVQIKCPCRDIITDEPDKDQYCRTCLGSGFLWDERKIIYFKDDDSERRQQETFFYLEYFIVPRDDDYIIELVRDLEGNVVSPPKRDKLFKIKKAEPFISDTGRVEYWRCRTTYERPWSVWYDVPYRGHSPD